MKKNLIIRIAGDLQGTLFRQEARQKAEKLGLNGTAQYEEDGNLHIEVEGEPEQLEAYLQWCEQGPEGTRVSQVDVEEGALQGYDRFLEMR
ncbi:hypothetical protein GCM10023189_12090 [Nibrella saemangeumensis]|uniref:acylphosphatase n=1 Tax=Nibrella saemangeumensis TaxID=1084526 RepID=A0ABP8MHN9_9BACT